MFHFFVGMAKMGGKVFYYKPRGVEVARVESYGDRHLIIAYHAFGLYCLRLDDYNSEFIHRGDLPPREQLFRALAGLHDEEIHELWRPKEGLIANLMTRKPKPVSKTLETLVRAICGELYWPCCWTSRVGNVLVRIGTGQATVVELKHVETNSVIVGRMSPGFLKEALDFMSNSEDFKFQAFCDGRRIDLQVSGLNGHLELNSLEGVETFLILIGN